MTSYTKWDRDAYIERVGGPGEAERHRKLLMARQSGQRLAEERKRRPHPGSACPEYGRLTPHPMCPENGGNLITVVTLRA